MNNLRRYSSLPPVNFNGNKWPMLNSIYCSFLLLIIILFFNGHLQIYDNSLAKITTTDFTFKFYLEDGGEIRFYINQSNSVLSNVKITQNSFVYNYDIFDVYELTKALTECFYGTICKDLSKSNNTDNRDCFYFSHIYLISFCFNQIQQLTYVRIFNQVILTTYDVDRFMLAIKYFINV